VEVLFVLTLIGFVVTGVLYARERRKVFQPTQAAVTQALQAQGAQFEADRQAILAQGQQQLDNLRREAGQAQAEKEDLLRKLATAENQHMLELQAREKTHQDEMVKYRHSLEVEWERHKRDDRAQSNARSRSALVAKIGEHFAPLLGGFPYNFKDARHIGELFDYLVFDGLEDGEIRNIVFMEIKSGKTYQSRQLQPRERMVKSAIEAGHVRYEVFTPDVGT
jgi:predicted Holliday junction resolvase-like endonuclease